MAPPEETKEVRERLFQLEFFQRQQEKSFGELRSEMCETRDIAEEARAMSLQTQAAVEGVPGKVMEAFENKRKLERKDRKFEFREWMSLISTIVMVIAAIYTATSKGG